MKLMIRITNLCVVIYFLCPLNLAAQTVPVDSAYQRFSSHLEKLLVGPKIRTCEVFYLSTGQSKILEKQNDKINGYHCLAIEKFNLARTKRTIQILTDTTSFICSKFKKSCAFEPEIYLRFRGKRHKEIHVVISVSCEQAAIVTKDFKTVFNLGELSVNGVTNLKTLTSNPNLKH
ncbi:hypothetical protein AAFN85_13635 [Mucilaginibacter sp. CAU 1740]|uniref:hypothetical protein n=1 Tax=Mucilaginibacter sp. CAU 1740 TaxID=3140365 RepID=UPI00325ADCE3